jgi:hypothetical protein
LTFTASHLSRANDGGIQISIGSDPVARMAEMTAHVAAELRAGLSVIVPGVDD